jgi:hypothetical protein
MTRPLPWTELVSAIGEERFAEIRESLAKAGTDDLSGDAFMLNGTATNLLRDLMPDEAPAEAITAYGALLHMLHACWARDWPVVTIDTDRLRAALSTPIPDSRFPIPVVCYVQLPERLVWAEPAAGEPHEPLDGIFLIATPARADALAVLGFRAARDGFTTMEGAIALPSPPPPPRPNGAAAFSSTLPGGDRAALISVVDAHELSALALLAVELAAG